MRVEPISHITCTAVVTVQAMSYDGVISLREFESLEKRQMAQEVSQPQGAPNFFLNFLACRERALITVIISVTVYCNRSVSFIATTGWRDCSHT